MNWKRDESRGIAVRIWANHVRNLIVMGCAVVLGLAAAAMANDVHHVPGDHATIQAAIDAAADGDTVLVAAGTYEETIDYLGKTITIESADGPEQTVIDGSAIGGTVVTVASGEGPATTLRGFTITGGTGTPIVNEEDEVETWGGGVRISTAALTIDDCIVIQNEADRGAAIAVHDNATLTATNVRIEQNTGTHSGFATHAVLVRTDSHVEIDDCIFEGNDGGGLQIVVNSSGTVTHTLFEDNIAALGGGAAVAANSDEFLFEHCTFRNNTGGQGGGLNVNTDAVVTARHCVFESNQAAVVDGVGNFGAGAYVLSSGTAVFENCHWIANHSVDSGGGVRNLGTLTIRDSAFEGNVVEGGDVTPEFSGGGGLSTATGPPSEENPSPVIENTLFIDNVAPTGGGMRNTSGRPVITNCLFEGNIATFGHPGGGGGIVDRSLGSEAASIIVSTTFRENSAVGAHARGGGYQSFLGHVSITDSVFEGNTASRGGGVSVLDGRGGEIVGTTFVANESSSFGGGLTLSAHTNEPDFSFTISDCTFESNTTQVFGGGIFYTWDGSGTGPFVDIDNTTFMNNVAAQGGGIAVNNRCYVTVSNSHFEDNTADHGGGVHLRGTGHLSSDEFNTFDFCEFRGNRANRGGAISQGGGEQSSGSKAIIQNCSFIENETDEIGNSPQSGGAMFVAGASNAAIHDSTFAGNISQGPGGAIALLGWAVIDSNIFCENEPDDIDSQSDYDNNAFLATCPATCAADLTGSSVVNVDDLLVVLNNWGPCPPHCPADITGDGEVGLGDLVMILNMWGPCEDE